MHEAAQGSDRRPGRRHHGQLRRRDADVILVTAAEDPMTTMHVPGNRVGGPNAGKTVLFNALTGSRQKVSVNYAGVTVERKEGTLRHPVTIGEGARSAGEPIPAAAFLTKW